MIFPRKLSFIFAFPLLFVGGAQGAFDQGHALWDQVLRAHVEDGLVDYQALVTDSSQLNQYLDQLNSVSKHEVDSWPREQQLAFWINAYNALTVRAILDHYPIETRTLKGLFVPKNSIIQIPGVWKKLTWAVAGQSLTLDHIEHGLIRPHFKEPRIHFSIVCAAIGCPDLRSEAYTSDKLEAQLEEQTKHYLSDETKGVRIDFENRQIWVSHLFKWFTADFEGEAPPGFFVKNQSNTARIALRFISRYRRKPAEWELFQTKDVDFDFLSYDWSLNDKAVLDD